MLPLHAVALSQIVGWVKERMLGGIPPVDCVGRGGAPVELKVLGVLRILGRATCFDGITELSGIPTSSMQAFFHRFTAWFRKDVYPEFVYVPKTREDLARVETPYALVGLPGCIGSMDVVHIAWCMCPTYLMNLAKGKEGYTSIAYNVICDHKGRAQAVLAGTYGAFNDKTIVRYDNYVHAIRTQAFFTELQYEVRTGPGACDVEMVEGAYLIIDGGYHKWAATQAAAKVTTSLNYTAWRTRVESVRKDIECFFGRLKARFRVLKTPISLKTMRAVDDVFFTCVALQNIILDWDHEFNELTTWDVTANWECFGSEGVFADDEGPAEDARWWCRPTLIRAKVGLKGGGRFIPESIADFSSCGRLSTTIATWDAFESIKSPAPIGEAARYDLKQAKLVTHFAHARSTWLLS